MFKITKDEVTVWVPNQGYARLAPSIEFQAFAENTEKDIDGALHGAGYSKVMGSDSNNDLDIEIYEHDVTGELVVILDMVDLQWLAGIVIAGHHADAFMLSEYLRMREQLARINSVGEQRIAAKAQVAFIRHGHGTTTVGQFGDTKEEMENMREDQRLRAAAKRLASPAGA